MGLGGSPAAGSTSRAWSGYLKIFKFVLRHGQPPGRGGDLAGLDALDDLLADLVRGRRSGDLVEHAPGQSLHIVETFTAEHVHLAAGERMV